MTCLSTRIQLMVSLPNPHFTLCCIVLVFFMCPWELQLKMKAIKELLGIILLLGMACSSAWERNHGRSLNNDGHRHRGGNEDKMGRRKVCDHQLNMFIFICSLNKCIACLPGSDTMLTTGNTEMKKFKSLWTWCSC